VFDAVIFGIVLSRSSLESLGLLECKIYTLASSNLVGRFLMLSFLDIGRIFSRARLKGLLFALWGESGHGTH
jgi:hypothetical protein